MGDRRLLTSVMSVLRQNWPEFPQMILPNLLELPYLSGCEARSLDRDSVIAGGRSPAAMPTEGGTAMPRLSGRARLGRRARRDQRHQPFGSSDRLSQRCFSLVAAQGGRARSHRDRPAERSGRSGAVPGAPCAGSPRLGRDVREPYGGVRGVPHQDHGPRRRRDRRRGVAGEADFGIRPVGISGETGLRSDRAARAGLPKPA